MNLGCGFDTLFFRLRDAGHLIQNFVEIDFPSVTSRKCYQIKRNKSLLEKIHSEGELQVSCKMKIVSFSSIHQMEKSDYHQLTSIQATTTLLALTYEISTNYQTNCNNQRLILVCQRFSSRNASSSTLSHKILPIYSRGSRPTSSQPFLSTTNRST